MNKDLILEKIIKSCFWDYNIDKKYLENAIKNASLVEKAKIVKKIIKNMKSCLDALILFDRNELKLIFENFDDKLKESEKVKLLENCLFNKNHRLPKYEWKKY